MPLRYKKESKYEVGDIVCIRYDIQADHEYKMEGTDTTVHCTKKMSEYRGQFMAVLRVDRFHDQISYVLEDMDGNNVPYYWVYGMFEEFVESVSDTVDFEPEDINILYECFAEV